MIMVADDEQSILEVVRATLVAHDYRVITAKNGEEALALFKRHRSKLRGAIVDLNMPGKSGQQVLKEIRAANPQTVLVAMSGMLEWNLDKEQINAALLPKPFGPERLLEILRDQLDPAALEENRLVQVSE
jgi:DNA-binding NtrC family response regulator